MRRRELLIASALAPLALHASARAQEVPPLVDVALDPGHSRVDVGAAGGGLREFELTLDLAWRVTAYLEASGLTVRLTRFDHEPLTALRHPDPIERTRIEQTARIEAGLPARIFVSLHFNGASPGVRGTETYYNPARSGDGEDRALAESLQSNVVAALAGAGYATRDRGARSDLAAGKEYGHFFSLRGPIPSALLESLFLSDPYEAEILHDEAIRDALARGCAQGIREYLAPRVVGAPGGG